MNINLPTTGIKGLFRCVVHSDQDMKDVKSDTGFFSNLITDVGMNRLGSVLATGNNSVANFQQICGRFVVGSGSAEPQFTDTALQNPVAFASSNPTLGSESSSYSRGWYEITVAHTFGQGEAAGNISEIGIQHSGLSGPLWSRALILDGSGDPTTITVLETDFLTCYYTLRIMIPKTDSVFTTSVVYDDIPTPTTITIRPFNTELVQGSAWGFRNWTTGELVRARTGTGLVPPTTSIAPGSNVTTTSNIYEVPYVPDSYEKRARTEQNLSGMNGPVELILIDGLLGGWQAHFDPPLNKDDTQVAELTFGVSWARA